jgi:hypothetical protein
MPPQASKAEKRTYPRYRVDLPARLSGTRVSVRNLSLGGLQVACSGLFFDLLSPKLTGGTCAIDLGMHEPGTSKLPCRLVYVNEYGGEYLIGLLLDDLAPPERLAYGRFIESIARSHPPMAE